MKRSKKIISIIIAMLITVLTCVPAFAKEKCSCGNTPVILVSGFGATTLAYENEDGSKEVAFPFGLDAVKKAVTDNIDKFNTEEPLDFPAAIVTQLLEPVRMNPDGTPVYDLVPIYSSVEDTSLEGFKKNDALKYVPYTGSVFLDMEIIGEKIGDDHVFNFLFDWRISSDEVADQLLEYIEDVLEYTGHDKVSIYCLSQGSICVAQYIYKYADKGYVDNLIFNNPIFEGSDFITDLITGRTSYKLSYREIIQLVENILHTEIDVSQLADILPAGLDTIVEMGASLIVIPTVKDSPAYLEMVPKKDYDMICETYYTAEGNDILLEKTAKTRNGFMADIEGTLRNAEKYGTTVSIVSSSGKTLVTGTKVNSDSIVNVEYSCGAFCAEWGETFPSDYVQKKDIGHNCISPDRTIDLSCGYLPERTWIINDLFHGMVEWSPASLELMETLLYTHELKDAWSSKQFPQFIQSDDPSQNIQAVFSYSNSLSTKTGCNDKIIIKNTSSENVLINSINLNGEIKNTNLILKSGESTNIDVDTDNDSFGSITVDYSKLSKPGENLSKAFMYSVKSDYSGIIINHDAPQKTPSFLESITGYIWKLFNIVFDYLKGLLSSLISK